MRVTYQREMKALATLQSMRVESYVPMTRKVKTDLNGHVKGWEEVPLVHGYIFVHESLSNLKDIKLKIPPLRYMMVRSDDGGQRPQYIREKQLEDFRRVVDTQMYEDVGLDTDLLAGDRVRIKDGPLAGVEGIFVSLTGKRGRRVVVKIEGIVAVVTAKLKCSEVEKISDEQ